MVALSQSHHPRPYDLLLSEGDQALRANCVPSIGSVHHPISVRRALVEVFAKSRARRLTSFCARCSSLLLVPLANPEQLPPASYLLRAKAIGSVSRVCPRNQCLAIAKKQQHKRKEKKKKEKKENKKKPQREREKRANACTNFFPRAGFKAYLLRAALGQSELSFPTPYGRLGAQSQLKSSPIAHLRRRSEGE